MRSEPLCPTIPWNVLAIPLAHGVLLSPAGPAHVSVGQLKASAAASTRNEKCLLNYTTFVVWTRAAATTSTRLPHEAPSPRYWIDKSIDHARFSIPDVQRDVAAAARTRVRITKAISVGIVRHRIHHVLTCAANVSFHPVMPSQTIYLSLFFWTNTIRNCLS